MIQFLHLRGGDVDGRIMNTHNGFQPVRISVDRPSGFQVYIPSDDSTKDTRFYDYDPTVQD